MCHFDSFGQFFPELVNKLHSLTAEKEGSDGQRKFMKRHIFYLFRQLLRAAAFLPLLPLSLRFAGGEYAQCENSTVSSDQKLSPRAALYLGQ